MPAHHHRQGLIQRLAAIAMLALAGLALAACSAPQPPFAQLSGLVLDGQLGEISGLAASRQHADTLWMHNDGGNAAAIYAVSRRGRKLATVHIAGVENTDWEDIAAFDLDGHHYLLIADTGDNGGLRHSLQLHVVEEPATLADATVQPVWSIAFRWPDGPRDCEAVAVDAVQGRILLVSKKRQPPQLFELPLRPKGKQLQVARPLGTLAGVPLASVGEREANPRLARIRSQVTAADIAPDGHAIAVLTYRDVLVYRRRGNESWQQTLSRQPDVHPLPWLPQAEALGWSANSQGLYASGEISPSPLFYLNP